jgi:hypothetical protein
MDPPDAEEVRDHNTTTRKTAIPVCTLDLSTSLINIVLQLGEAERCTVETETHFNNAQTSTVLIRRKQSWLDTLFCPLIQHDSQESASSPAILPSSL